VKLSSACITAKVMISASVTPWLDPDGGSPWDLFGMGLQQIVGRHKECGRESVQISVRRFKGSRFGSERVDLPWIVDGASGVRQPAQCLLCLCGVCCGVLEGGHLSLLLT
jgi:hypothetical protein